MRSALTTASEVAGLALIVSGLFVISTPLGLLGAGLALFVVGFAEGRK
jgi:hypothetical protein